MQSGLPCRCRHVLLPCDVQFVMTWGLFWHRFWDGIYVLYTYAAQRKTSHAVQKLLSTPVVGKEKNVLRHMTFITN